VDKIQRRRDAVERALMHHKVDYSPPSVDRPSFLISTSMGRLSATLYQAEWYCRGLADAKRSS
jgi:hypothetical protein